MFERLRLIVGDVGGKAKYKCFCLPVQSLKEEIKNAVCFIYTSDCTVIACRNVCKIYSSVKIQKGASLHMCPGDYEGFKFSWRWG